MALYSLLPHCMAGSAETTLCLSSRSKQLAVKAVARWGFSSEVIFVTNRSVLSATLEVDRIGRHCGVVYQLWYLRIYVISGYSNNSQQQQETRSDGHDTVVTEPNFSCSFFSGTQKSADLLSGTQNLKVCNDNRKIIWTHSRTKIQSQ
jgi:hypothetical protein